MLNPTRCLSSWMMTPLLEWRNPQGREEHWLGRPEAEGIGSIVIHLTKVTVTEGCLILLAFSAIIETVAYAALALISRIFARLDGGKKYAFFAEYLDSSAFTTLWILMDLLVNPLTLMALLVNPEYANILTHESFARYRSINLLNSWRFIRHVDSFHVAGWARQHGGENSEIGPIFLPFADDAAWIESGASLLINGVLAHLHPDIIQRFEEIDPSMFMFVLTKAVFASSLGPQNYENIPGCFKRLSLFEIARLRLNQAQYPQEVIDQVGALNNPEQFAAGVRPDAAPLFTTLRSIAARELQHSVLTTRCWPRACERLDRERFEALVASTPGASVDFEE
ncbi:MAG: hypothetical protein ACHQT8_07625 [Chlamydiales bacterium]